MAIAVFTPDGTECEAGEPGELVCLRPFPCQPAGFWPLAGFPDTDTESVDAAVVRHQDAYFATYKGVWCKFCFLK